MSSANMTASTRNLWIPGVKEQVWGAMPLLQLLLLRKQIRVKGGLTIKKTLDIAEMDDLAQEYGPNEPLESSKKAFLATAKFAWKKFQVPIEYDEEEESENRGGVDTAPVDLVDTKVKKGTRAARIKLYKSMYGLPSGTSDTDKGFQGLPDALDHDLTYGTLARATTVTRQYWQGGSYGGTFNDRNTARTASIQTFRVCRAKISQYVRNPGDLIAVMGSTIFQKFQGQVEASGVNPNLGKTRLGTYGFTTLEVDGVEFVEDPWLNLATWGTGSGEDTTKWFFLLHVPDYELRLFPGRDLRQMTPFKFQGANVNGYDKFLARVFVKGNFVCWQPNASIWLSNVA